MCEWRTIARSPTERSGIADCDEVQRPVQIAGPQAEVTGADRRDEAIVEGLRDVEGGMDPVPAGADRELVGAQLARVEEAQQLDASEMRLEELPVLARVVFAQVPRVVGFLRTGWGQGEAVGGRDVGRRGGLRGPPPQPARGGGVAGGLGGNGPRRPPVAIPPPPPP